MNVLVTRPIPQAGLDQLHKAGHQVTRYPHEQVIQKSELLELLHDKDALLCLLTDPIDEEVIESAPHLRVIANYAVGYNNIDISAATKRKIPVCNTPDVLTDTTAEHAWALLFSVARRVVEGDNFTRDGHFSGWGPLLMLGQDVTGKMLGVIGAGRIGTAFALKSRGFDMDVLYTSRRKNDVLECELGAQKVDLQTLLSASDFVSIHVPLTDQTKHLIGKDELSLLQPHAILINTSRGPVIDEQALIDALTKKSFFGAGLDVFEQEPFIPQGLKDLDSVILQPHSGSATIQTRTKMAIMAATSIIQALDGKQPDYCVNKELFEG